MSTFEQAATSVRQEQLAGARQQSQPEKKFFVLDFSEVTRDQRNVFLYVAEHRLLGQTLSAFARKLRDYPVLFPVADAEIVDGKHGLRLQITHERNWPDAIATITRHLPAGLPAIKLTGDVPSVLVSEIKEAV